MLYSYWRILIKKKDTMMNEDGVSTTMYSNKAQKLAQNEQCGMEDGWKWGWK
jgi:hypothetical protein